MAITLADLIRDQPAPVTAGAGEPLSAALDKMLEHDFSLLPVVESLDGDRQRAVGLVSMASVARALVHLRSPINRLTVGHATEPRVKTENCGEELFSILDNFQQSPVVLVVDDDGALLGLVTDFDITEYLRRSSQGLLFIEDIEQMLKQLLQRAYDEAGIDPDEESTELVRSQVSGQLRGDCWGVVHDCLTSHTPTAKVTQELFEGPFQARILTKRVRSVSFDRLTFQQYIELLLREPSWSHYSGIFELEPKALRSLLEDVRDLRNRLAHFRGALSALELDRLTFCRDWLVRVVDELPETEAVPQIDLGDLPDETDEDYNADGSVLGRYLRLAKWLGKISTSAPKRLQMSFDEIDVLVDAGLPQSAREHSSWWSNNIEHPQGLAWTDAGWRVVRVNLGKQQVIFERSKPRERAYIDFFSRLLNKLTLQPEWRPALPSKANIHGMSWQPVAYLPENNRSGAGKVVYAFTRGVGFRIEVYIDTGDVESTQATFEVLRAHEVQILEELGLPVRWERKDGKRACRVLIEYEHPVTIESEDEQLVELCDWAAEVMPRFYNALKDRFQLVEVPTVVDSSNGAAQVVNQ